VTHAGTCSEFERWLDAGEPPALAPAMLAHAAACARCAGSLEAMRAIEAMLAAPPPAPAGFDDAVMARVARVEAARVRVAPTWRAAFPESLPWWAIALQQPTMVLAAGVAALLVWRAPALLAVASAGAGWLATTLPALSARGLDAAAVTFRGVAFAGPLARPLSGTGALLATGLGLGFLPLVAWASLAMGNWVSRAAARLARPS